MSDRNGAGCPARVMEVARRGAGGPADQEMSDRNGAGCPARVMEVARRGAGGPADQEMSDRNGAGCPARVMEVARRGAHLRQRLRWASRGPADHERELTDEFKTRLEGARPPARPLD